MTPFKSDLDHLKSDKELGCIFAHEEIIFRLFAPRAKVVQLVLYDSYDAEQNQTFDMLYSADGVWECALSKHWVAMYYCYYIQSHQRPLSQFGNKQLIADPYSRAVCTRNTYLNEAKSIVLKPDEYDWEGDRPVRVRWEDLTIYELHVRDMTAHRSSSAREKGTYHGLVEKSGAGGLNHILELGVNAVELLPCQEFANIEPPYEKEVPGFENFWNPNARNHWGYMTSYFFAPESYYASSGTMKPGAYCGKRGEPVKEFKDMVKAFHKEGIAVIMDVVYNHVSQYDLNPLKAIDREYYFRLTSTGAYEETSGCGNDFKTERPMARRLIVDSVKHWLTEYHVDGFRFDLAAMIDWQTVELIREEARRINPGVILLAEAWGGGKYDLAGFSEREWAVWNDIFRNGIKGENPSNGLGWIFGKYWEPYTEDAIRNCVKGSTRAGGGPFVKSFHSLNYLESHDGYTLGDFIRIGLERIEPDEPAPAGNERITPEEMLLHKLAATFLCTSQGPLMIAAGQEFGRSKVIAETTANKSRAGLLDHDSYARDDETNWLNYEHKALNRELFDFYRQLITLREDHPAFRRAGDEDVKFFASSCNFSLGYFLSGQSTDDSDFCVLMNANPKSSAEFMLKAGLWEVVLESNLKRSTQRRFRSKIKLPPRSAVILEGV